MLLEDQGQFITQTVTVITAVNLLDTDRLSKFLFTEKKSTKKKVQLNGISNLFRIGGLLLPIKSALRARDISVIFIAASGLVRTDFDTGKERGFLSFLLLFCGLLLFSLVKSVTKTEEKWEIDDGISRRS